MSEEKKKDSFCEQCEAIAEEQDVTNMEKGTLEELVDIFPVLEPGQTHGIRSHARGDSIQEEKKFLKKLINRIAKAKEAGLPIDICLCVHYDDEDIPNEEETKEECNCCGECCEGCECQDDDTESDLVKILRLMNDHLDCIDHNQKLMYDLLKKEQKKEDKMHYNNMQDMICSVADAMGLKVIRKSNKKEQ